MAQTRHGGSAHHHHHSVIDALISELNSLRLAVCLRRLLRAATDGGLVTTNGLEEIARDLSGVARAACVPGGPDGPSPLGIAEWQLRARRCGPLNSLQLFINEV